MNSGITWQDVSENDRVLMHYRNVNDLTDNEVIGAEILSLTLNRDFVRIRDGKSWAWLRTCDYELVEILPPVLPETKE